MSYVSVSVNAGLFGAPVIYTALRHLQLEEEEEEERERERENIT